MSLTSAAVLATTLSFVLFAIMAVWYAAPWLQSRPRLEALTPLVWINAFRHVALQIFSAQHFGFVVSDGTRDQIVAGDLIGMILAVAAIVALHYQCSAVASLGVKTVCCKASGDCLADRRLLNEMHRSVAGLFWTGQAQGLPSRHPLEIR